MGRPSWQVAAGAWCRWAAVAAPAHAQLNTPHIKGTVGLKSSSQAPPHWYAVLPLVYVYDAGTVRHRDGNRFPVDAILTSAAYAVGVAKVTTNHLRVPQAQLRMGNLRTGGSPGPRVQATLTLPLAPIRLPAP